MKAREDLTDWTERVRIELEVDKHQNGDLHMVRKFYLIPTCLKGVWRWGYAVVIQRFVVWHDYDGDYFIWDDVEFV